MLGTTVSLLLPLAVGLSSKAPSLSVPAAAWGRYNVIPGSVGTTVSLLLLPDGGPV